MYYGSGKGLMCYFHVSSIQAVPQVENEREGAACNWDDDKRAEN